MIKIAQINWNADSATLVAEEAIINSFLSTVTLNHITAVDEFLLGEFTNVAPASPSKVKIFKLADSIGANGISGTVSIIENFLSGKTLLHLLNVGQGAILAVYEL